MLENMRRFRKADVAKSTELDGMCVSMLHSISTTSHNSCNVLHSTSWQSKVMVVVIL